MAEEFNGQQGTVLLQGEKPGRWAVQLDNAQLMDGKKARLFPAHSLRVIASPAAAAAMRREPAAAGNAPEQLGISVTASFVRQSPQYTLAAITPGVYVIGMQEQFNASELRAAEEETMAGGGGTNNNNNPLAAHIQYVSDEMGFVLFDRSSGCRGGAPPSVDQFGPYFIEQYILLEALSKHEVAQNVLDYFVHHREKLQRGLAGYSEVQGQGFICWRFLINHHEAVQVAAAVEGAAVVVATAAAEAEATSDESPPKRQAIT